MKKLLAILVLSLLWCNTGFAGKLVYECINLENNIKRVYEFDTNSRQYRDLKPNLANIYSNFILTKTRFLNYSVDGGPFGYWVQTRIFLRKKREGWNIFVFDSTETDKKTFEEIISKLDEIDNGELNKKLGSGGTFIYSLAPISNNEQFQNEMKKYNMVKPYALGTIENNPNHSRFIMQCKEIKN